MNIKGINEISKKDFIHIYRSHVRYKFKLRRSLYMSVGLFVFGLLMEYGIGMDFSFLNTFVFWIMVAAYIVNAMSDYVFPKIAYNTIKDAGKIDGWIELQDTYVLIRDKGSKEEKKEWNVFDTCIECEEAFLLYEKDQFTIIMKTVLHNELDNVRSFLKDKVNKGRTIQYKR